MDLVLGGTGIVGANLVLHLLNEEATIRVMFRSENKKNQLLQYLRKNQLEEAKINRIYWLYGNIENYEDLHTAFKGIAKVYHCANRVSFDERDRKALLIANHLGTKKVVDMALEMGIEKLAFVGSVATFDAENGQNYIDENSHWNISIEHSSYAESKYLAELEVWRGAEEGLPVIIVNPGVVLSDYDFYQSSGQLFSQNAKTFSFSPTGNIPLIDVNDISKRLIFLMNSDIQNEQYILVGESIPMQEMNDGIRTSLDKSKSIVIPKKLLLFLGKMYQNLSILIPFLPRYNKYFWRNLTEDKYFSTNKIEEVYPSKFSRVKEAIQRYSVEFKEQ